MAIEHDIIPEEPNPAHFQIIRLAADYLTALAAGNGLGDGAAIRNSRGDDTTIHRLTGNIVIDVKPELSHTQINGRAPRGEVVGSKADVVSRAQDAARKLLAEVTAQKEIVQLMEKRPGRGFGAAPYKMKLSQAHKDYAVVEACSTCHGQGTAACGVCHRTGKMNCPNCHGSGQEMHSDGTQSQCHICHGHRQVACGTCQGKGQIPCQDCGHTGYWTHHYNADWQADTQFVLDRKGVDPGVLEIVDTLGIANLALQGHAEIFRQPAEMSEQRLHIAFIALLPVALPDFSVNSKNWPTMVAGLHGRVMKIDPFLDTLVKPGIMALSKLSKGPMAAEALMQAACKFRLVRAVISGLSHHTKRAVYQKLLKDYPLVLSEKYAKASIKYASDALMALSRGPRRKGLIFGTILSALLSAAWFMGPVRSAVMAIMTQKSLLPYALAADGTALVIGWIAAVMTIKLVAAAGLKKMLPSEMQSQERGLPSAGDSAAHALLTCTAAFIACALFAAQKPGWIAPLAKMLGI